MTRPELLNIMNAILAKQGKTPVVEESLLLRDIGFKSLDFSEMALRVERCAGRELNFDAALMRAIETPADVLNFFEEALTNA